MRDDQGNGDAQRPEDAESGLNAFGPYQDDGQGPRQHRESWEPGIDRERTDPGPYGVPSADSPASGQPSFGQPSFGQSSFGQPSFGQPTYRMPDYGQPSFGADQAGQADYPPPPGGPGYG